MTRRLTSLSSARRIGLWGAAAIGYWLKPLGWFERALAMVAAFMLVVALPVTDEIGFALAAVFVAFHVFRARKLRKEQAAA